MARTREGIRSKVGLFGVFDEILFAPVHATCQRPWEIMTKGVHLVTDMWLQDTSGAGYIVQGIQERPAVGS